MLHKHFKPRSENIETLKYSAMCCFMKRSKVLRNKIKCYNGLNIKSNKQKATKYRAKYRILEQNFSCCVTAKCKNVWVTLTNKPSVFMGPENQLLQTHYRSYLKYV